MRQSWRMNTHSDGAFGLGSNEESTVTSNQGLTESEVAVALCSRIGAGDRDAETDLDTIYRARLRYLLIRRSATHDVEDLVQRALTETIVRLRARPLDNPAGLGGFLYRTAVNMQNAERRTAKRRATEADTDLLDNVASGGESQDAKLIRAEDAALLHRVLMNLEPERYRELLVRYYLRQEEKEGICQAMELSSLHFNRVLYRAKNALKKLMIEARDELEQGS